MSNKSKQTSKDGESAERDPLIITESELLLLPEKERNEFRLKGGTVTADPPIKD